MNQSTAERIICRAIKCLAQNKNAGLDEIANFVGVGRATLYRHFKCRAQLIRAIQDHASQQLLAVVTPVLESRQSARDKLVNLVVELVPLGASLDVCGYFQHPFSDDDPDLIAQYAHHLDQSRQLCTALKEEGAVGKETPLPWLMGSLDALIFEAWNQVAQGEIAPRQAPWLVLTSFLAGCGTPEAQAWLADKRQAH